MAVVDPLRTLRGFAVPIVIATVGIGSGDVALSLALLPLMVTGAVLVGLLPWLTTRWRVTPTQLQVRRGLVSRTTVTAPLDRVRSVDLEASLLHRLLGLVKVQVGTGVDDTRIELDALAAPEARELRSWLLARRTQAVDGAPGGPAESGDPNGGTGPVEAPPPAPVEVLARIDWSWLRFAPFSLARLVLVTGAVGALSQMVDDVPLARQQLESAREVVLAQALGTLVLVGSVVAALGWLVVSTLGYVLQWWDLLLVRTEGALRLTAGLLTTRSTTVEEERVRGLRLSEPVLLRAVGGAELHVLATGVGAGGTTKVLPPSPRAVDVAVGHRVLDRRAPARRDGAAPGEAPLAVPLVRHGGAARRRCHLRALRAATPAAALAVGASVWAGLPAWVPVALAAAVLAVAAGLGELAWRHLGHALTPAHLVAGHPSPARSRTVLQLDGVVGWNLSQTWWQRRAGLATLTATTAAGPERVDVVDVDAATALALADRATPGLLDPFLRRRSVG